MQDRPSCRVQPGLFLAAAVALSLTVSTAIAQPAVKRVGPELAVRGVTQADRAAKQTALRSRLRLRMPTGAMDAPIRVDLTLKERANLRAKPRANVRAPLRIGMTKSFPPGIEKVAGLAFAHDMPGKFKESPDGGVTWAVAVSSPGAQAIRVRFRNFFLPPGAAMYFYDLNGAAYGPYVGSGRNGNGEFWTRSMSSETGVIQLRIPGTVDRRDVSFVIADLAHISGRVDAGGPTVTLQSHDPWPCAGNAPCMVDANCVSGTPADPAKTAIAKVEWAEGTSIFACSGGLLADTVAASQIPYFLTANHCFNSSIANLETWFNYTTDSCNGDCPHDRFTGGAPSSDTIGITVLRTGSAGDYTLGTLNQAPPAGAVFLGWNSTPIAFSSGVSLYRISNPHFGPQVYSQHEVNASTGTCAGILRGSWIYSDDITGATSGGSSGAPVLNAAGEVVGQLTGCCGSNCADDCAGSPLNSTIDGAFAFYFNQVEDLLNPQAACFRDSDCDDGDACTTDTCVNGACSNTQIVCLPDQTCDRGTCVSVGACCVALSCSLDTAANCSALGGSYGGDGRDCDSGAGDVTVYQSSPGVSIPDGGAPGNPATDTIAVPDSFPIGDVDLGLTVTHTWVGDLIVTLSHGGATVTVLDRPGVPATSFGCGLDNFAGIILDDEGSGGEIEAQCATNLSSPPNYTPSDPLDTFDGMDSAGDWTLAVLDAEALDLGMLDAWSLHIEGVDNSPPVCCQADADCAGTDPPTANRCIDGFCEAPFECADLYPGGTIDLRDFAEFQNQFGGATVFSCPDVRSGDLDGNGTVDFVDFKEFERQFGGEDACACPLGGCRPTCGDGCCSPEERGCGCPEDCGCVDSCDCCWIGTINEGHCPLEWATNGVCDCGCQFVDPECRIGFTWMPPGLAAGAERPAHRPLSP